jgi:hypothetical protein
MAFIFGDGFDLYAAPADAVAGYWDSGTTTLFTLAVGRFIGSQAIQSGSAGAAMLVKSSGSNDPIHHIVCAFDQTAVLSGTTAGLYISLGDGATAQCSIVFRSDGAVLLTSGGPTGTTLATYTGAVSAQNTWTAFEFEVVINNTTGSFTARKNGNTSNDFTLGSLNTRTTANNYANRISIGNNGAIAARLDDLLWRSDASSVAWIGDVRCYTRMPASDASAQFSRSPATLVQTPFAGSTTSAVANTAARFTPFIATYDGTIATVTVSLSTGYTGNMKCTIFASSGTAPTTVLGNATPISNPVTGSSTFTFSTPVTVTRGTQYWIGFMSDTSSGFWTTTSASSGVQQVSTSYAAFPTASPATGAAAAPICTLTLTVGSNAALVNETLQDGATSYVYDANVGDADFYTIAATAGTPTTVVAVTTRGFVQKSDAGSRSGAVQLKSGATTVASTTTALSTTFAWLWRTDQTDPATSAAWTPTGVNNVQIGPVVIS